MKVMYVIFWFLLVLAGASIAIGCLSRRGRRGVPWAVLALGGAVATFLLVDRSAVRGWEDAALLVGLGGLIAMGIGCVGLTRRRVSKTHCPRCGYDFRGTSKDSGARCPECGTARPSMAGHCLACKADIRSAIAGGTIKCPVCGAPIAPST